MRHGIAPYNVSLWDADPAFVSGLGIQPSLRVPSSPFEYVFSYRVSSELKRDIAGKLGYTGHRAVLLTPSGTAANLVVLNLLRHLGKTRLWIVLPSYFQVPIAAQEIGFEVFCDHAKQDGLGWSAPDLSALDVQTDVVWVTHPIYGIGETFTPATIETLRRYMAAGGLVVGDECQCMVGTELGRHVEQSSGFIGTYSPHKSVCMNGVKLGAVIADLQHVETLEYLSDIWAGPLTRMSISDAEHFLSRNFDEMLLAVHGKLAESEVAVRSICEQFGCTLLGSTGPYRAVHVNGISRDLELSLPYVSQLIHETGTSFLPSYVNLGPTDAPFSFRVNLARRGIAMEGALGRLLGAIRDSCPI
ncbi:aminotransferase class I/II-fold pyridoxal phosphate-dependent enzyme [Trinickia dinghuensis]|uniref:aminotransferase class I/II-fold pyridoxal phosphate-dependent enzyme n=1 Tax=Trinickia dinghuensis TaxID=2291023 RepID=UPI001C6A684A|nr:aminotransferase class I/II-fold pyridoxal phosphate-dependent enzyme [Trinickia dinghuensis]